MLVADLPGSSKTPLLASLYLLPPTMTSFPESMRACFCAAAASILIAPPLLVGGVVVLAIASGRRRARRNAKIEDSTVSTTDGGEGAASVIPERQSGLARSE